MQVKEVYFLSQIDAGIEAKIGLYIMLMRGIPTRGAAYLLQIDVFFFVLELVIHTPHLGFEPPFDGIGLHVGFIFELPHQG